MKNRFSMPPMQPFSDADDAKMIDMARCGLVIEGYRAAFPDRRLGDILERRLQLREEGRLELAPLV
jgi:hypothetical protein